MDVTNVAFDVILYIILNLSRLYFIVYYSKKNCERKEAFVTNKNADSLNQTSGIKWTEFFIFELLGCRCVCVCVYCVFSDCASQLYHLQPITFLCFYDVLFYDVWEGNGFGLIFK